MEIQKTLKTIFIKNYYVYMLQVKVCPKQSAEFLS